jgi:hypothetical protein
MQSVLRRLNYLAASILSLVFLAQLALAQIDTGAIVGVVRDPVWSKYSCGTAVVIESDTDTLVTSYGSPRIASALAGLPETTHRICRPDHAMQSESPAKCRHLHRQRSGPFVTSSAPWDAW